jgi:hypothetical protein
MATEAQGTIMIDVQLIPRAITENIGVGHVAIILQN